MDIDDATILEAWPTCTNCLSWSADMNIAVVIGDNVEILSPNLQLSSVGNRFAKQDVTNWHRVRLETNTFSEIELPYVQPEIFRVLSIGEEQSSNLVTALAWSPPGLAKNQRCALAVLTTNHVLSIWASDTNPRETRSWKRVLIVNDVLHKYFWGQGESNSQDAQSQIPEKLRSRVQAFTWGANVQEALSISECRFDIGQNSILNAPYLVLSNNANEVIVLQIESPYMTSHKSLTNWDASIVTMFHNSSTPQQQEHPAMMYVHIMKPSMRTSHLTMTAWALCSDGRLSCTLAYLAGVELHLRNCELTFGITQPVLVIDKAPLVFSGIHTGPIRYHNQVKERTDCLSTFTKEGVVRIAIPQGIGTCSLADVAITNYKSNGLWSQISGASYDSTEKNSLFLVYADHMCHSLQEVRCLSLEPDKISHNFIPRWAQQVMVQKEKFDLKHRLAGHVVVRTWGIASSVDGDHVATCISLHPSDSPQYSMVSEQESILIISRESDLPLSSCRDPSTESCLFNILDWLNKNKPPGQSLSDEAIQLIERQLDLIYNVDLKSIKRADIGLTRTNHLSGRDVFSQLIEAVNPYAAFKGLLRYQLRRLKNSFSGSKDDKLSRLHFQQRFCSAVLHSAPQLCTITPHSQLMLNMYQQDRKMIGQNQHQNIDPGLATEADETSEQCEICNAKILFEDFDWAYCSNDHQFLRCGLTFFALQAPGITKRCGICDQRFLTEENMREKEKSSQISASDAIISNTITSSSNQSNHKLDRQEDNTFSNVTELLIRAFPVCLYCGGKFVG